MKCFYHKADLDGICSAAIVHQKYPKAELIGIDYGDEFTWGRIELGEEVWMVDFSLQPFSDMVRLHEVCNRDSEDGDRLVWIDHHKSALADAAKEGIAIAGIQRDGIGACALVWEFIADDEGTGCLARNPTPRAVELLARYDVWDHSDPDTLPFQYGIRLESVAYDPADNMWERLLHTGLDSTASRMLLADMLANGRTVLRYIEQDNALKAQALCFDFDLGWAGADRGPLHCIAANFGPSNSQLFDSVWDPEKYDAMLLFSWRQKHWTISLYTTRDDVDVSVIAKAYGGGGHKGAAGFQVPRLSEIGL